MNFFHAFAQSEPYGPFAGEMRDLAKAGELDEAAVCAALERYSLRSLAPLRPLFVRGLRSLI